MLVANKAGLDAANAYPGAPFWDGIGGTHQLILTEDGKSTGVLEAAHARGQAVHIWTYRIDAPPYKSESAADSMRRAIELGVDGVFTDFPDLGVSVIDSVEKRGGR
jgi:glycerophosphoryl diester phosphodiesterase